MIVVTGPNIKGKRIVKHLGIISVTAVVVESVD